ncbi:MAG TPA: S8 family serine peptidase [Vicinamibacterales bacterium]|nr:S8 family serine peptidase [Vicinamibacterales bacterium]
MRGRLVAALLVVLLGFAQVATSASVDPLLIERVSLNPLGFTPIVITYDHQPGPADLDALRALNIRGGVVPSELPMVLTAVNLAQFNALRQNPRITSLYANRRFPLLSNKSRPFIGINAMLADAEVTARNSGLPLSGRNIGVAYVDTGIDGSHGDVFFGRTVAQNVLFPLAEVSAVEWPVPDGFTPVVALEDQPVTDVQGGHGTFGAAVTAGSGAHSGNFYGGVAPGAKLIGLVAGNDAGLTTFAIVQAFNYALVNQFRYNIRVCNNSWGASLATYPYDPEDPINRATRAMHDRNIVVVFAAGNGIDSVGDVPGAINPFSVAPWVISVGAGEKEGLGQPAGFSSRGEDNGTGSDVAGQPADPAAPPNLRPDLIGSGVDIKSARSKGPGVTNIAGTLPVFVGANDLTTIAPAFLPFYTTSQGTSFSTPQVAGVVALMLEANPTLTPDDVVTILRATATPMPYDQRTVGAGYVDAHNAVRAAMGLTAVPHPAVLIPTTELPEIMDAPDDQLGTAGQDIRLVDFSYDAAADQIVYEMTVSDLKEAVNNPKPNQRWTMSSDFGTTTIFVTASIDETGTAVFNYGRITTLATGTRNQQTIGAADAGSIDDVQNRVTVRLARAKVVAAVGSEVLLATSTNTAAQAQILIGTSLSGGLLLASDNATGRDWKVGEEPTDEPPPPPPACVTGTERFAGVLNPGAGTSVDFTVACPAIGAQISFNPGNQPVGLDLLNASGAIIASSERHEKLKATELAPGRYTYRVRGPVTEPVDFVIKSTQAK